MPRCSRRLAKLNEMALPLFLIEPRRTLASPSSCLLAALDAAPARRGAAVAKPNQ
jgi:hypothetical protein